jgi:GDP-L-fucose synthase
MKKVFISGHRGMVGSALLRTPPSNFELFTAERSQLDLKDKQQVKTYLLKNGIEYVVLAAAKVGGIGANSNNQLTFLLENLLIQNSVIEAAVDSGVSNLVFLGSSCIYPKFAPQPILESSLLSGSLEPTNEAYAIAKIAGLKLCEAIQNELDLNYFSVMPTNLYGPGDNFDLHESHVLAALLRKIHFAKLADSLSVDVWGTGEPLREFMHVDDLASAIWFLLEKERVAGFINVGTGEELTIRDLAKKIASLIGFKGTLNFDSTKPDGTPRKLLDSSRITNLGWIPKIPLDSGLSRTYSWLVKALENGKVRGI